MIHLWDLGTQRERCRLIGHTGSVTTLTFNAKSQTLISGGFDTTLRMWQLKGEVANRLSQREAAIPGSK